VAWTRIQEAQGNLAKLREASIVYGKGKDADGKEAWTFIFRNKVEGEKLFRELSCGCTLTKGIETADGIHKALTGLQTVFQKHADCNGQNSQWLELGVYGCEFAIAELDKSSLDIPEKMTHWPRNNGNRNELQSLAWRSSPQFFPELEKQTLKCVHKVMKKTKSAQKMNGFSWRRTKRQRAFRSLSDHQC